MGQEPNKFISKEVEQPHRTTGEGSSTDVARVQDKDRASKRGNFLLPLAAFLGCLLVISIAYNIFLYRSAETAVENLSGAVEEESEFVHYGDSVAWLGDSVAWFSEPESEELDDDYRLSKAFDGMLSTERIFSSFDDRRIIYSSDEYTVCNGVYPYDSIAVEPQYFSVGLFDINKNHFAIEFEFKPQKGGNEVLMLSNSCRILGVHLSDDGHIGINTDNMSHYYATPYMYSLGKWNHLRIEYSAGVLLVNDYKMQVTIDYLHEGDSNLSSINYAYGGAYLGSIGKISVESYHQ